MATWRFRRRVKIIPGVRLNLSRSGISTSVGIRGANLTFKKDGAYLNTGLPGTGIYKRQKIASFNSSNREVKNENGTNNRPVQEKADNICSAEPVKVTSQDMAGVKQSIIDAHSQRIELQNDIKKVKKVLLFSKVKLVLVFVFIVGLFLKKIVVGIKENIKKQKEAIIDLEKQKKKSFVELDVVFDKDVSAMYEKVIERFKELINADKICDITREEDHDMVSNRSMASRAINRKEVKFSFRDLEDIKYEKQALCFHNANGADFYFYPSFIVMQGESDFGVVGLNEIEFNFDQTNFVEQDKVPSDTEVIDHTWFKVNKNGTPDKRFKDNYQIPVVKYGTIKLKTDSGVNEEYQFSNYNICEKFSTIFIEYKNSIKNN